ncbi:monovalent cation/H+ antiporter subunit D family protein [Aeromicrobium sp. CTD01-1L150]|uniref:monovalent cation/H+ antiporter subunit D family protein n=1 Tax=Aeromicrobium sp. CTD01-1L150 TaxID=3341830 RepID=UPI0035C0996C
MTDAVLPLLVGVPLGLAGLTAMARREARWTLPVMFVTLLAVWAVSIGLVAQTRDGSTMGHSVGAWPAGIAIPFVADQLSSLMLVVTGLLALVCSWFAVVAGTGRVHLFAPFVLVLVAGVNGALLTADLFNLFVFIEVMLLPSYGLLILAARRRGSEQSVRGSRLYVTFNLLVSTVFLAGVGLVYGIAGTVNIAELAGAARDSAGVAVAAGTCLVALSMKAATFPAYGWLARAYPSTSPAVTALFSGLHTKVAIYAIYRIYAVVFDGDTRWLWIGLVVFTVTMVVGVLGAVGEQTTRSILAFHMVSQIGYILLGVAIFTAAGLAAGLFYLLHHMIVKASLFLSAGAVEVRHGSARLDAVAAVGRREPLLAAAFAMSALSLAGLPPFSGFVAKLSIILASFEAGHVVVATVAIIVSLLTLLSMLKIWDAVFASPEPDGGSSSTGAGQGTAVVPRVGLALTAPGLVLALVTLCLGLGAEGLLSLTQVAAEGLLDTSGYVDAVLGGGA